MNSLTPGVIILLEVESDLENITSGNTTPYETVTPPNGIEIHVKIAQYEDNKPIGGTETPVELTIHEDIKPSFEIEQSVKLTTAVDNALWKDTTQLEVINPLAKAIPQIKILLPVEAYDAHAQPQPDYDI